MTTITPASTDDAATLAQLWNTMASLADSCWYQAVTASPQMLAAYQDAGMIFVLAVGDEEPTGFGFWQPTGGSLRLYAHAAQTAEVYYRLMVAYADWGIEHGLSEGWGDLMPRQTREMGWMSALEVIVFTPIGYEPLVAGQDPAMRAVGMLRATSNLSALRQAALDELGG